MELPKTDEIPASKDHDGQSPEHPEKNSKKNEISTNEALKVENVELVVETGKINGESTDHKLESSELKKETVITSNLNPSKPFPLDNGVVNEVKQETLKDIIAPKTDPEFVLTTKNLERVREELRQEEILTGKISPLKSVSASPIKNELVLVTFLIVSVLCMTESVE